MQIPYARQAVVEQTDRVFGSSSKEGDVVLLERGTYTNAHPAARIGQGVNSAVRVRTIEALNRELARVREAPFSYSAFPYRLDGVVNNVDGGVDESNYEFNRFEDGFKSHIIANVAVKGIVRLSHPPNRWPGDEERAAQRCDMLKTLPGSIVYIGLICSRKPNVGGRTQFTHRLIRFSSAMITATAARGGIDLPVEGLRANGNPVEHPVDEDRLLFSWKLGTIVDSNQSVNMLTICVAVDLLLPLDETERDIASQTDSDGNAAYVLRWTVDGNGVETAASAIPMLEKTTPNHTIETVAQRLNKYWKI